MAGGGFFDEVTFVPIVTSKGSKFKIAKNAYEDAELYVDSLLVKRNPSRPDKDSMRLTLRFPGGAGFKPETDTLLLVLDFFELTVAPNDWKRNRAGTKFTHTAQTTAPAKITIKVDQAKRTLSLTGKKMTLPGPDAATPEARIGVGFADFVKVNAVVLQSKTAKSGVATFRY